MDIEFLNSAGLDSTEIMPLFIEEVYFLLNKRVSIFLNEEKHIKVNEENKIIYYKTFEYVRIFSKLNQKKTLDMRIFIDHMIIKKNQENEKLLDNQFIICKIIDLMPITLEEINYLVPKFTKLFSFREGKIILKKIVSIMQEL